MPRAARGSPERAGPLPAVRRGLVPVGARRGGGAAPPAGGGGGPGGGGAPRHIVTIEDPIEYEHQHHAGVVEQVEIGVDAPDFPTALRASMRQAPDVIVVGEMRDPDTIPTALAAAEPAHPVLATRPPPRAGA